MNLCGMPRRRPPPPLALIFANYRGRGVSCSCSDAIRKADIRVGTGGEALKYGHFRQFLCACSRKMKPEQAQKNFLGNGKNLNKFQVYFEILKQLGLQFDAIRKTEGGQIPCWKRSSEKMNTWTSARIAAACFRKMPGDAEKSSARINAARHGITGILT